MKYKRHLMPGALALLLFTTTTQTSPLEETTFDSKTDDAQYYNQIQMKSSKAYDDGVKQKEKSRKLNKQHR